MEKRTDHLAEKIRRRREGEAPVRNNQGAVAAPTIRELERGLAELRTAVESVSDKPLAVARLLQQAKEGGHTQQRIADALGVSRSWVTKRLNLMNANPIQRAMLETGQLSVSGFYELDNKTRSELERGVRAATNKARRRAGAPYRRHRKYVFDEATAKAIAHLLNHDAVSLGLAGMDVETTKRRDLQRAITLRVHEIWDLVKPKS